MPAIFCSQAVPRRASLILPWVRRSAELLELLPFTLGPTMDMIASDRLGNREAASQAS